MTAAGRHLGIAALSAWTALVPGPGPAGADVIDRVLAVAAGNLILQSDLAAARELGLGKVELMPDPMLDGLAALIDRALVLAEVERYAPAEPDEADIAGAYRTVSDRFPSSEALQTALARVGLTEDQLRQRLRQDLRIEAYLDERFAADRPDEDPSAAAARRRALVAEWIQSLRRRATVIDLSSPTGR